MQGNQGKGVPKELYASVGVVVFSITAIASFAMQSTLFFYAAALLSIASGFYLSYLLSKKTNYDAEQKHKKR